MWKRAGAEGVNCLALFTQSIQNRWICKDIEKIVRGWGRGEEYLHNRCDIACGGMLTFPVEGWKGGLTDSTDTLGFLPGHRDYDYVTPCLYSKCQFSTPGWAHTHVLPACLSPVLGLQISTTTTDLRFLFLSLGSLLLLVFWCKTPSPNLGPRNSPVL